MQNLLRLRGIPLALYTDRHAVFKHKSEYQPAGMPTQFGRAMEELGIQMIFALSPRASTLYNQAAEESSCRQAARGLSPWARQVPNKEARVILLLLPPADRVPPLTLRLTTRCRRLRSAALLSSGTPGSATKTKSSWMWRSMRRHSLAWVAEASSRRGWQMASRRCSKASWAVRRCLVWGAAWSGDG